MERLPRAQHRDLGKGTITFSRTLENVSMSEKVAVKGLEPKSGHFLCGQRKK